MRKKRAEGANKISEEDANRYETLMPLLASMNDTFLELSRKKPDGILSDSKVKIVNRLLRPIYELMLNEPSHQFLDMLDEDKLPQNSDVVLVLSQAKTAMERFYERHSRVENYATVWSV